MGFQSSRMQMNQQSPNMTRPLRATCAPGLGPFLAREIEELGLAVESTDHTGVMTNGTLEDGMRMLLHLRTAFHVLQRFADIRAVDADMLHAETKRLPWERVIPADGYLTVVSSVNNETITNSMFANVKVKDAIVDRLQEVHGKRPDSGPKGDRTVVHLFWKKDQARLSIDLAGAKLSDRGYRRIPGKAPMRETIAAALLMETGFDGTTPLVVPMCGSGTIAIEAALMATRRPPGLLRSGYGVQHMVTFEEDAWRNQRAQARKQSTSKPATPIIASDIDPAMVDAARKNAATAGVDHLITFHECDFSRTPLPDQVGTVILHGEYGRRLGDLEDLKSMYKRMGDFLKQQCPGWNGYIFTARELAGAVGLKAARRIPFEHGGIDCRLLKYDLYSGSRQPG